LFFLHRYNSKDSEGKPIKSAQLKVTKTNKHTHTQTNKQTNKQTKTNKRKHKNKQTHTHTHTHNKQVAVVLKHWVENQSSDFPSDLIEPLKNFVNIMQNDGYHVAADGMRTNKQT